MKYLLTQEAHKKLRIFLIQCNSALFILLSFLIISFSHINNAQASITGVTGDVQLIATPASVNLSALQSDTTIFGFNEIQGYILTTDLFINGSGAGLHLGTGNTAIELTSSGTMLNSYIFHVEPVTPEITRFTGTVSFDSNILGIIFETNELNLSDAMLGATGTSYSSGNFRGFEGSGSGPCLGLYDCATISENLREITLDFGTSTQLDQIRIITSPVPVPATIFLFGSALFGIMGFRFRTK